MDIGVMLRVAIFQSPRSQPTMGIMEALNMVQLALSG